MMENLKISISKQHDRNFGLDLARAVAISFVIVSHFSKVLKPLGFWGVELFFALSGFLIGNILWRNFSTSKPWNPANIFNFWSRRWWRTLPSYYLFLMITLIFQYYVNNIIPSVSDLYISLWFGQFIVNPPITFYGVSWSLCIEEWFYLLFPIIVFFFNKLFVKPKWTFIAAILFFVLSSTIARAAIATSSSYLFPIREITFCRLDAIVFGVGVAFFSSISKMTFKIRLIAFLIGLGCLIPAVIMEYFLEMDFEQAFPIQILGIIAPLGFALILPMASILPSPKARFSFVEICIKKISLWSYSMYLSHIPILFTIYFLLGNLRDHSIVNFLSKVMALIVTILISCLLYNFFELPFTRKRPSELKTKRLKLESIG